MANIETWTPYFRLLQYRNGPDGSPTVVGDTRQSLSGSEYGRNAPMGISTSSIKYGTGFISVEANIPIHHSLVQQATYDNQSSEMAKIFNINNYWKVEFGWTHSSYQGGWKIADMKLSDWSMDYDTSTRTFALNVNLRPTHNLLLKDIKVFQLAKEINELRTTIGLFTDVPEKEKNNWGTEGGGGHPLSLANVITKILTGCRRVIRDSAYQPAKFSVKEERNMAVSLSRKTPPPLPNAYAFPDNSDGAEQKKNDDRRKEIELKSVIEEDLVAYPSELLRQSRESDIPDPKEVRLMLMGSSDDEVEKVAIAFKNEPMAIDKTLNKLSHNSNKDMNCLVFISSLLTDNGFTWWPTFEAVNKDGKLKWNILQLDFNNIGKTHVEQEFENIERSSGLIKSSVKRVKTFGGKDAGNKNLQLFDLHSNRNMVISVNASTDQGRTTVGTAHAADALIEGNNTFEPSKILNEHKNSLWVGHAVESKEMNLECMGMPEIKIGDNIFVNLAGDLYSGKYKLIEMEHKFDGGFSTSLRGIRTKTGFNLNADPTDQPGPEIEAPPAPKEKSKHDEGKIGEFGTPKDVRANPRRYR